MKSTIKIILSKNARVFLLEDSLERIGWFQKRIENLTVTNTADEAIAVLAFTQPFDFLFLDHDLGEIESGGYNESAGNGEHVADHLAGTGFLGERAVIHSWNPSGAMKMKNLLNNAMAIPFGVFDIELVDEP
jgi:hypothetical protein